MSLDSKWMQILKDADIQLGALLSFLVLWLIGHLGGLGTLEWLVPWFKAGAVVSGCFFFLSCVGAFLRARP